MGKVYDDWGRLVEAVVRREKLRRLCYEHSRTPSHSSSDSSSLLDELNLPTYLNGDMPSSDSQRSGDLLGGPSDWLKNNLMTLMVEISSEMDEPDTTGHQSDRELSFNWSPKASDYQMNLVDPNSYSPYTPPILEEPSSSFSEDADDNALPAIKGLQISGDAFPGSEIQACGYSINGTTSCNFEWVRHLEDGSFLYVDGPKEPSYFVTADDLNTFLALDVQPLNDRKMKGNPVRVFANEHRKITYDPKMLKCIEKNYSRGHASYNLSLSTGFLNVWEPAMLAIKRDGYSIKSIGPTGTGFVVKEKFLPSTIVSISSASRVEFSITDSMGIEHLLRVEKRSLDISGFRDTIVLTLRLFILKNSEKKKQKTNLLFNIWTTRYR